MSLICETETTYAKYLVQVNNTNKRHNLLPISSGLGKITLTIYHLFNYFSIYFASLFITDLKFKLIQLNKVLAGQN